MNENNTQHMYLAVEKWSGKEQNIYRGRHRVGVVAFQRNPDDDSITISASMVSKSEPHGFSAKKGIEKAMIRLKLGRKYNVKLKRFEALNGYPLRMVLADLNQATPNNYFNEIDWQEFQRKFEHTIATMYRPSDLSPMTDYNPANDGEYPFRMHERWDENLLTSPFKQALRTELDNSDIHDHVREAKVTPSKLAKAKLTSKKKSTKKSKTTTKKKTKAKARVSKRPRVTRQTVAKKAKQAARKNKK